MHSHLEGTKYSSALEPRLFGLDIFLNILACFRNCGVLLTTLFTTMNNKQDEDWKDCKAKEKEDPSRRDEEGF